MIFRKTVLPVSVLGIALLGVSACVPTTQATSSNAPAGYYDTGGLGGPPSGRTSAERQARKDYYRGPRGHEF